MSSSTVTTARDLLTLAGKISSKHEILANKLRVVILAIIVALGNAKWSDIKILLEKTVGPVNPNTLAFHIKKLIEAGWIERSGSPESPSYVAKIHEGVRKELTELINSIEKIKALRN